MARQMDVSEVIVKPGTEIGKFKKEFTVAKEIFTRLLHWI